VSAANGGDLVRVKALLAQGFDVNTRGPDGQTALMLAAFKGNMDV
jgi:ankyrin repeat protein